MAIILDVLIFLAPHLLSILSDLVAKWNHDVPESMMKLFWQDFDLVKTKFATLPMSASFREKIKDLEKEIPDSSFFVQIMETFSSEWNVLCAKEVDNCISLLSNDLGFSLDTYKTSLTRSMKGFESSWKAHLLMPRFVEQSRPGLSIIDDAMLCVERMLPNRFIASSGMLSTQTLLPFWLHYQSGHTMSVPRSFFDIYNVEYGFGYKSFPTCVVMNYGHWFVTPKIDFITKDYFTDVFHKELDVVTMYELANLECDLTYRGVFYDINMKPSQIFQKILGSSITSLEMVISKMSSWLVSSYIRSNPGTTTLDAYEKTHSGPFYYVDKLEDFMQPYRLYQLSKQHEVNTKRLELDFRKLNTLISLYRSEVSRGNVKF